jgi:hypothetical protein
MLCVNISLLKQKIKNLGLRNLNLRKRETGQNKTTEIMKKWRRR